MSFLIPLVFLPKNEWLRLIPSEIFMLGKSKPDFLYPISGDEFLPPISR